MKPFAFSRRVSCLAAVLVAGVIWPLVAAAAVAAPLSDSMSWDEIGRAMEANPPKWDNGSQRAKIANAMDKLIHVQVKTELTAEQQAEFKPMVAFYRQRVDRGLEQLEKARVTKGVQVFKFYSSSFVFKSAEGTVALDFCQGPINNGGEPEARDERKTGFYLTPEQRDHLAKLVDVSLITHRHHDHSDYSLSKRMLEAGKKVIGPAQLKALWPDLAGKLTVPDYGKAQKFGPVQIFTMLGYQYAKNEPETPGASQRVGVPNREHPEADSETVVYLFRLGGLVFVHGAENHVPENGWLQKGVALGFRPDVKLSTGQFQGERALEAALKNLPPCFILPRHDYEMTHEHGGNRTGSWFSGRSLEGIGKHSTMPLFWGETFLIPR